MNTQNKKQAFDALCADVLAMAATRGPLCQPRKLRKTLKTMRGVADDVDYREALVLINCMGRMSPVRTRKHLVRLRDDLTALGDAARFERLARLIRDYLHPVSLTQHGYNATFGQMDGDHIYRSMGKALAPLQALNRPFYIYAGALLGHVRDGALIAHDDDLDCAIMLGECAPDAVAPLWRQIKVQLAELDLLTEASRTSGEAVFKMKTDLGVVVDLFPSWTYQGRLSVYPYALEEIDPAHVLPLRSFGHDPLMNPADPEAFLAHCYGPDWRIPDPYFSLNWKQKYKMFHRLLSVPYALDPRDGDPRD
ncbi:hypothetical protein OO012_13315 [Rhodobacteraceae bacterium KMM 6894]|nr:hypothetical protein [Rhodobacteraceae bacterium KMM 6894]